MSNNPHGPAAKSGSGCHSHQHEAAHDGKRGPDAARGPASLGNYTCPMHPEVRQVGPGLCPICGMALEPLDATVGEDDSEFRDMRRRFVWSMVFTLPILLLAMGDMVLPGAPVHSSLGASARWLELAFA
ncbi:MAG: hypothetical protein H6835_05205, partial [Planctomycetes bacterium]|nr:hypothetical protein [Planctomycetota bacterium]